MKKITQFLMICAFGFGVATTALAAGVTLTLAPVTTGIINSIGGTTDYTLSISGLHASPDITNSPALGGYNVVLNFDSNIVLFGSVVYGSAVNDFATTDSSVSGQVTLSNLSFSDAATLQATQAASFTMATVTFQGAGPGTSSIAIDPTSTLSDEFGNSLAVVNTNNTTIQSVPEPSGYALALFGFLLVLANARRRMLIS